jgi:hypothetical protein
VSSATKGDAGLTGIHVASTSDIFVKGRMGYRTMSCPARLNRFDKVADKPMRVNEYERRRQLNWKRGLLVIMMSMIVGHRARGMTSDRVKEKGLRELPHETREIRSGKRAATHAPSSSFLGWRRLISFHPCTLLL